MRITKKQYYNYVLYIIIVTEMCMKMGNDVGNVVLQLMFYIFYKKHLSNCTNRSFKECANIQNEFKGWGFFV